MTYLQTFIRVLVLVFFANRDDWSLVLPKDCGNLVIIYQSRYYNYKCCRLRVLLSSACFSTGVEMSNAVNTETGIIIFVSVEFIDPLKLVLSSDCQVQLAMCYQSLSHTFNSLAPLASLYQSEFTCCNWLTLAVYQLLIHFTEVQETILVLSSISDCLLCSTQTFLQKAKNEL